MREPFEVHAHKGYTIEVHQDDDSCDATEALQGGNVTLFAWHKRYSFGDDPPSWADEAADEGRLEDAIREHYPEAVILPVFMYDHSGIRLSTGPFSCRWDSGQLGVIFTTEAMTSRWDEATKAWIPAVTDEDKRLSAENLLRAIVEEMDDRVSGNVWGYVVKTPEGAFLDSCWGFVGDKDRRGFMLDEARAAVDRDVAGRESGERLVAECFAL